MDFLGLHGRASWEGTGWTWTEWVPTRDTALIRCVESSAAEGPPPPDGTRIEVELRP